MEVGITEPDDGLSYPYWKVALAGDRAEVAEWPCKSDGSENLVFHEDLVARLHDAQPALAFGDITAGWLVVRGAEAVLYLHLAAGGLERVDPREVERALGGWCAAAGVETLTVADFSRRKPSWGLA